MSDSKETYTFYNFYWRYWNFQFFMCTMSENAFDFIFKSNIGWLFRSVVKTSIIHKTCSYKRQRSLFIYLFNLIVLQTNNTEKSKKKIYIYLSVFPNLAISIEQGHLCSVHTSTKYKWNRVEITCFFLTKMINIVSIPNLQSLNALGICRNMSESITFLILW